MIACALHSGETAPERFNIAGLLGLPLFLGLDFSTGVILLLAMSG